MLSYRDQPKTRNKRVIISTTFFDHEGGHDYDPNDSLTHSNNFQPVPIYKINELIFLLGLTFTDQSKYRRIALSDPSGAYTFLVDLGFNPNVPMVIPDHYPDDIKCFLNGVISGEILYSAD